MRYPRLLFALVTLVAAATARAQLLDTTLTLGKTPDAVVLPVTIPADGSYRLTLTDFGSASGPARLARLDVGLASGSTLVTAASVTAAISSGTVVKTFSATAGERRVIIIGQPNPPALVGSAGVRIDDPVGGAVLLDTVQTFTTAGPATGPPYEHEIAVNAAGTYTLRITDFALPRPLNALQTTAIRRSDGALLNLAGNGELVLTAGGPDVFEVFVYAELPTGATQGLLGVSLSESASGATQFSALHEIGEWPFKYPFDVGRATTLSLSLSDLGFPLPLATLGVALVHDGQLAAPELVAPGTSVTPAPVAGAFTAYASATAAAGANAGSFGLTVTDDAGARLVETVQNVVPPGPVTDVGAIDKSFDIGTAGDYTLTLTDFGASGFFSAFMSIELALTRDNQIVQTLSAPGQFVFAATPGHYSLAILADPAGPNGQGLLGVTVTGGPGNATVYEDTAAVGIGFLSATFDVSTPQTVDVTLTDLAFPATFDAINVAVTRGATRAGEITGEGKFSFAATTGKYFVNLLATPDAQLGYSTLGLNVQATPLAPVVTLGASATSVVTGGSAMLTWSSTNAKTCVASGGWTGGRATSGTASVGPLNANTTFTLTCTGDGGSDDASVDITIAAAQRSGGGGAVDGALLLLVAILALVARVRRRRLLRGSGPSAFSCHPRSSSEAMMPARTPEAATR